VTAVVLQHPVSGGENTLLQARPVLWDDGWLLAGKEGALCQGISV